MDTNFGIKMKPHYRLLSRKWIFKVKKDVNRAIARLKIEQMVKSYLQQFAINFSKSFIVVVHPIAFTVLFIIAAYYNLHID